MKFLEKDLEQIIYETEPLELCKRGIYFLDGKALRQLRIGNYGVADLVYFNRELTTMDNKFEPFLNINIVELKKDKIGISALLQSVNYLKGIKSYIEQRKPKLHVSYNITLIGKTIDTSGSFIYLTDIINAGDCFGFNEFNSLSKLSYYTYDYNIDGLKFKSHCNYTLKDEGFKL
jgi:hypothetical protein